MCIINVKKKFISLNINMYDSFLNSYFMFHLIICDAKMFNIPTFKYVIIPICFVKNNIKRKKVLFTSKKDELRRALTYSFK